MSYKLICFDMDGVLFEQRNFWLELHRAFGTLEEGKALIEKYLYADYDKLVEEVVGGLWKGKDAKPYYELVDSIPYLEGVQKVFEYVHAQGWATAIISGSSIDVARRVQKYFGVDHLFANEIIIKNGIVTGEFLQSIGAGMEKKAIIIQNLCKDLSILQEECIYIGDSDIDIEAFKEVGLAIAFNSNSKELKKAADVVVKGDDLRDVIKHLP